MYFLVLLKENNLSYNEQASAFTLLTCLMLRGLVQMFVHGETKQKNNNAQLLLPYNSE